MLRQRIAQQVPPKLRPVARRISGWLTAPWARVRLAFGRQPLSSQWANDRGLPIHRYYLAQFLEEFRADIRGHCLEFQDGAYCTRFGKGVSRLDIMHIDSSNTAATIVADLTKPNNVAADTFDCIVCTHVLHVVFDVPAAIAELHRILKPGGVLLVAVPAASMCGPHAGELWRFTAQGLRALLESRFGANVTMRAYGNSLSAAAELRGLVADELGHGELDYHDARFAVEVCARTVKPPCAS